MNETRWVQHISGQGEKWKLADSEINKDTYSIWEARQWHGNFDLKLPRSEYTLCDSPEVWVDVTGECEVIKAAPGIPANFIGGIESNDASVLYKPTSHATRYRLRKIAIAGGLGHAFIVERKQS